MHFRVISTSDETAWHRYLGSIPHKTLVHYPCYARVYERYGDGTVECFVYEDGDSLVLYPYLRRLIPGAASCSDIITPYGYGGFVYRCEPNRFPKNLIADFRQAFEEYACSTRTISEFVRFHPLLANHEHCIGLMDHVKLSSNNIFLDLRVGKNALFQGYRRSYKTCLRKAENSGVTVDFASHDWPLDAFFNMYHINMEDKKQTGYFNFRRSFLDVLAEEMPNNLLSVVVRHGPEIIGGALLLRSERFLDYFLAASDLSNLKLYPNHFLIHKTADWAIDNGFEFLQLGGGHESLLFFKHGFGNDYRPYYIGTHVFDSDTYKSLSVAHWLRNDQQLTSDNAYFPAYRAEFPTD